MRWQERTARDIYAKNLNDEGINNRSRRRRLHSRERVEGRREGAREGEEGEREGREGDPISEWDEVKKENLF